MNQAIETIVDGFSDHFSSGNEFCVESMQNVLQVLSFSGLLWVEKLEEFLDKRWGDMHFKGFDVSTIIDD